MGRDTLPRRFHECFDCDEACYMGGPFLGSSRVSMTVALNFLYTSFVQKSESIELSWASEGQNGRKKFLRSLFQ